MACRDLWENVMPQQLQLPALDPATLPTREGSSYPEPFRAAVAGRSFQRLGDACGLTDFGVNLVRLRPGAASSQRHWHKLEDELVYVLEGEPVLVTDIGEQRLGPGMAAGFPKGKADGHHLVNRGTEDVVFLVVGSRHRGEEAFYPDIDLHLRADGRFAKKSGELWE
jgi:uncharacterized cupin superfamily protein